MNIIRITDSKIKVTMTEDDFKYFKTSIDALDYNTENNKNTINAILDEIKHQSGFDALDSKIYIQLFCARFQIFARRLYYQSKNHKELCTNR